jgi:signal transduction histidine kinase
VIPLEDLARVAKALGAGDLRARSGFRRRDEVGDLARSFDEMGDRIERLLLAEKELMANVSHELRTPLARLRVALDIAGEADPDTGRLSMTEMSADLDELETLVDDILTATRLEIARGTPAAAHFELRLEDTASEVICERASSRFRSRHPTRPLTTAIDPNLPAVRVDPVLFRRVVDNLLENAHKYSPDPTSVVTLRVRREGDGVAFEVADRGMGIADADRPHVFSPFFRSERSRVRAAGGVGLGLTLAKRVVDAHRGAIEVESAVGVGTTFRVVLPPQ